MSALWASPRARTRTRDHLTTARPTDAPCRGERLQSAAGAGMLPQRIPSALSISAKRYVVILKVNRRERILDSDRLSVLSRPAAGSSRLQAHQSAEGAPPAEQAD